MSCGDVSVERGDTHSSLIDSSICSGGVVFGSFSRLGCCDSVVHSLCVSCWKACATSGSTGTVTIHPLPLRSGLQLVGEESTLNTWVEIRDSIIGVKARW